LQVAVFHQNSQKYTSSSLQLAGHLKHNDEKGGRTGTAFYGILSLACCCLSSHSLWSALPSHSHLPHTHSRPENFQIQLVDLKPWCYLTVWSLIFLVCKIGKYWHG
jgi:hypothetical protein